MCLLSPSRAPARTSPAADPRRARRRRVRGERPEGLTSGAKKADLRHAHRAPTGTCRSTAASLRSSGSRCTSPASRSARSARSPNEAHFNEVFITDGRVPAENLVGDLNQGWRVLQALAYERSVMGDVARGPRPGGSRPPRWVNRPRGACGTSTSLPWPRRTAAARPDGAPGHRPGDGAAVGEPVERPAGQGPTGAGHLVADPVAREAAMLGASSTGRRCRARLGEGLEGPDHPDGDAANFLARTPTSAGAPTRSSATSSASASSACRRSPRSTATSLPGRREGASVVREARWLRSVTPPPRPPCPFAMDTMAGSDVPARGPRAAPPPGADRLLLLGLGLRGRRRRPGDDGRAWKGMVEGRSALRSWLYRIATNTCLDARASARRGGLCRRRSGRPAASAARSSRSRSRGSSPIPTRLLEGVAPSDESPDAVLVARETIELAFLAAIQLLPPRQRAALILRDVLGWSARETAEALETSVASANSALQRARATLADHDLPAPRVSAGPEQQALVAGTSRPSSATTSRSLVMLLHDDAVMSMPPYDFWLQGADQMRRWFLGGGAGCEGSRLVPVAANVAPRSPLPADGNGGHTAWSIQVLEVSGDRIRCRPPQLPRPRALRGLLGPATCLGAGQHLAQPDQVHQAEQLVGGAPPRRMAQPHGGRPAGGGRGRPRRPDHTDPGRRRARSRPRCPAVHARRWSPRRRC